MNYPKGSAQQEFRFDKAFEATYLFTNNVFRKLCLRSQVATFAIRGVDVCDPLQLCQPLFGCLRRLSSTCKQFPGNLDDTICRFLP